jgi:hypothetical protein
MTDAATPPTLQAKNTRDGDGTSVSVGELRQHLEQALAPDFVTPLTIFLAIC